MRVPVFYLSIPKSTAASEEIQVRSPGWIPKRNEARKSVLPGLVTYL